MKDFDSVKRPIDCKCIKIQQNTNKVIKSKRNLVYTNITKGRTKTSNIGFKLQDGRCIIGYGSNVLLVEKNLVDWTPYKSIHYKEPLIDMDNQTYFEIVNNLDIMSPEFKKFLQENKLSISKVLDKRDELFVRRYIDEYGCLRPNKVDMDFLDGVIPKKFKSSDIIFEA